MTRIMTEAEVAAKSAKAKAAWDKVRKPSARELRRIAFAEAFANAGKSTKRSKYNATKTVVDNITFDSAKEARRYRELKLMEKGKQIVYLTLQPQFPIVISGTKVFEYRADFSYRTLPDLYLVVEDTKGFKTDVYRLKKRCVEAQYGITITET